MWSLTVLTSLNLLFLCQSKSYQTSLEQECRSSLYPTVFYDNSCFISTETVYSTKFDEWQKLHSFCNHMPADTRHLAILKNRGVIEQLMKNGVVHPDLKYFIGTRAANLTCKPSDRCCPESSNFHYFDDSGQEKGLANKSLWLRFQPDNLGVPVPKGVVTLEPTRRINGGPPDSMGFNDVDGSNQGIPLICEYRRKYECPDGFFFNDGTCTGLIDCNKTPEACEEDCILLGAKFGTKAMLPSIHNDDYNWFLAVRYRQEIIDRGYQKMFKTSKKFAQYWPVMIGMKHVHSQWVNLDQTPSDYFRWWSLENKVEKLFKNPDKGHKYVFLMVRVNGDNGISTFGYWANVYHDKDIVPLVGCQIQPKSVNG